MARILEGPNVEADEETEALMRCESWLTAHRRRLVSGRLAIAEIEVALVELELRRARRGEIIRLSGWKGREAPCPG